ncbi:MFS transporter [Undibacterium sp. RTI2.1]|uniref:MFS transporter n=1 Tax=unclassified Undibacterium TaxID=2630295 RepID=UPI002AB4D999|nr:MULTISPECIES: MFS transporter [unclassified Undibacterium]MDY7537806.1 MFS transporter [Undibacterium sp. 5I1]MEB0030507.1 MFS transporter [Undibacterium sp. RTI2.1]MEB0116993.1 MFS transporter [Undibacterium sp. RTI2.2]MEB0229923.1 MFS transporter [Undibacterium sp. 10I3]MEB0257612.1 MFS transporter [Undibacterium sp. 5I1]
MLKLPGGMSRLEFHGFMVLLLSMYSFGNALILPTLPLMQKIIPGVAVTWVFSSLILGFGSTQLIWGTMADRWGRRKVLLAGLAMLTLASVACFFLAQAWQLFVLRFAQGAGIAAAGVCARAMIRDHYAGEHAVSVLSLYFALLGLVGLVGLYLAGYLIEYQGLAGALVAYATLAALAWGYVLLRKPRCVIASLAPLADHRNKAIVLEWRRIAMHPVFCMYTALTACSYLGQYIFLTQSPFLLIDRCHWSVVDYGGMLSLCSLLYVAGTLCCRSLLPKIGIQKLICRASVIGLIAGFGMIVIVLAKTSDQWLVILPYFLYIFAHAIHQSCGQAAAMAPFRNSAAQASGLLGTILPLFAVITERILIPNLERSSLVLPAGVFLAAILTAIVAWIWIRKNGDIGFYRV